MAKAYLRHVDLRVLERKQQVVHIDPGYFRGHQAIFADYRCHSTISTKIETIDAVIKAFA